MGKVVKLDDYRTYEVTTWEALCTMCLRRWVATTEVGIPLKKIICKKCGPGYVVDTGENIER